MVDQQLRDGEVYVRRIEGDIVLGVGGQSITCTEFNARRLLAALALILELPLTKKAQSEIKMG